MDIEMNINFIRLEHLIDITIMKTALLAGTILFYIFYITEYYFINLLTEM